LSGAPPFGCGAALSLAALKELIAGRTRLVSSRLVLGETYTLLRMRYGHSAAWRFMDGIERSPSLDWLEIDGKVDATAWDLLRRYKDQAFSYVDATSFALMKRHRIQRALAFNGHFAAAGFLRIPLDAAP